jgi:hypothetical protein
MRWTDRLSTAQRVVVVVALGLALGVVASYLAGLGSGMGWYGYAPLSGQVFQPPGVGEPGWLRLIVWLAAIGLWAAASVRVLRQPPGDTAPELPVAPNAVGGITGRSGTPRHHASAVGPGLRQWVNDKYPAGAVD